MEWPRTRNSPDTFWKGVFALRDSPGLRRVQTSPWCSLGNANMDAIEKGTYRDEFSASHFIFFLETIAASGS